MKSPLKTKIARLIIISISAILPFLPSGAQARAQLQNENEADKQLPQSAPDIAPPLPLSNFDPLKYTLGPEDTIEITVMRHPEFSGTFNINQEGKLQYTFVGDMEVNGLTKQQLEEKIKNIISNYVISPEVSVTITEYNSKVFYVLGEVGAPGKYNMRSETIPVREAVFMAGLPTLSAAMRKCRIITPSKSGNAKVRPVNLYSVLYAGNLKRNINMRPGDVLYIPSTVMAKIVRVINPVTTTIGVTSDVPDSASTGKTAVKGLTTK